MKDWIKEIDQLTEDFRTTFGSLSHEQMNWKPDASIWSIAQNIDHLIVINETYFPILESLRNGTYKPPFTAKIGFLVTFFGNTILEASQPDRKKKMKTFSIWEPSGSEISGDILKKFTQHQSELKSQIEQSMYLTGRGTVISSPSNRYIVYSLQTAFDVIVTHERRHFEQAKEVLQQMNSSEKIL